MAATDDVRKPSHTARRRHVIFGDEHDALRESWGGCAARGPPRRLISAWSAG